jgi:NADH-quinone oxidoreductase subunit H
MPFGQYLIAADLDIGILFVIAVTSLVTIGLMTGGWASNNKWSLLGGIRSAAQIISYEIPGAVAVVCLVMMTGSLRLQDIIGVQGGPGGSFFTTGGWPYYWYVFKNPITFLLFFLYFTTALAEGNRAPFDLPEAESELVAGYHTEYSSMKFAMFFMAEYANMIMVGCVATLMFLGGWTSPFGDLIPLPQNIVIQSLLPIFWFVLKVFSFLFLYVWVRGTLPRFRYDQLMNFGWCYLMPLAILNIVATSLWLAY